MNLFNRIFNLDECSSSISPSNYFNNYFNNQQNATNNASSNGATSSTSAHHHHHANGNNADYNNLIKMIIQLKNCYLVRNGKLIKDDLFIRNGVILDPEKVFFDEKSTADLQIDCDGLIISPGFIDVQLNGAFGVDFTNNSSQTIDRDIKMVANKILSHGVTSFCPTLISSHPSTYSKLIPCIKRTSTENKGEIRINNGANVLGIHLEGPFISKEKLGAHDEKTLQVFQNGISSLEQVYGCSINQLKEHVSIITIAPELDLRGDIIKYLNENGIKVSIGHSMANLQVGERAFANGARFITHLFNAMLPFHHRDPHLIGLLSNTNSVKQEKIFYGVIADGIHTHPSAINISYRAHPNGLVLVTDAMAAMGLEDGKVHHLGNQVVEIVKESPSKRIRSAYLQGTNTLCGSVATMDDCVKNMITSTDCSLVEAILCATEHPAKMLDIFPRKGSLNYGADADFIVIDQDVNVKATFINGDLVWSTPEWSPLFNYKFIP